MDELSAPPSELDHLRGAIRAAYVHDCKGVDSAEVAETPAAQARIALNKLATIRRLLYQLVVKEKYAEKQQGGKVHESHV